MYTDVVIREAEKTDVKAMAEVVSSSWKAAYSELISEDDMKLFANVVRREELFKAGFEKGKLTYVLLCGGAVKGVCSAESYEKDGFSDTAEIDQFYLAPSAIGKGLGSRLMEFVLKEFSDKGFKQAVLFVMEGNERAVRFYERKGFKPDGFFSVCENLSGKNRGIRYIRKL